MIKTKNLSLNRNSRLHHKKILPDHSIFNNSVPDKQQSQFCCTCIVKKIRKAFYDPETKSCWNQYFAQSKNVWTKNFRFFSEYKLLSINQMTEGR